MPARVKTDTGLDAQPKEQLTAVVLADSFTQSFRPLTVERPKVLLPLVGVPLIEYTLEWLVSSGITEVVVFCCAHAEQVQQHLKRAGWLNQRNVSVQVVVELAMACTSAGDAFRSLDQKDLVKNTFVLVSGDVVVNMDLAAAYREHRERRQASPSAILTLVMKAGTSEAQRRRLGEGGLVVAVDARSQRLLRYEEQGTRGAAALDAHCWGERDAVEVRTDLVDTGIYLCEPDVLALFSDNWDYQNMRRDLMTGILSEEELGGKHLYVHELRRGYAARVNNPRTYDAVSRDVLCRWTFPFVPDTNVLPRTNVPSFRMARHGVYQEDGVQLARTATIVRDTAIGAGTVVEDGAMVEASVVGRGCRIGRGAHVRGAYLLDGAVVGAHACVLGALLANGVRVGDNAVVPPGAMLSFNVVVAAEHEVPEHARVSLCCQAQQATTLSDDELEYTSSSSPAQAGRGAMRGSEGSAEAHDHEADERPSQATLDAAHAAASGRPCSVAFDEDVVGRGGAGYLWPPPRRADGFVPRHSLAPPLPRGAAPDVAWEEGETASPVAAEDAGDAFANDPEAPFKREVSETFLRCAQLGFDQEYAGVEINGLKIAEDRSFADCARYILTSVMALCGPAPPRTREEYTSLFCAPPLPTSTSAGRADLAQRLQERLKKWAPLVQRFLKEDDDQVELLLTLEEFCSEEGVFEGSQEGGRHFATIFEKILEMLYDLDLVGEDAFQAWASEKAHAEEDERVYLGRAQAFLRWLREASEEDESESDSDDDS
ncbi:hypothetical protein WJX81_006406 [Elliptochloris bilobata]|uniref:Translation initiation factor eIF2B subunit epsilon n=1 Tax=Elliptochloris bilobata TaxID=381761 RepID=A0AAW1R145_9CHLO